MPSDSFGRLSPNGPAWYSHETTEERAAACYAAGTALQTDQQGRKTRALASSWLYESRSPYSTGLSSGDYTGDYLTDQGNNIDAPDVEAGLARSIVDTAHATVAGRTKPTVKFLTRGGDWKTKRRAEGLSDLIDAVFRIPQGRYQSAWALGQEIAKDCLIFSEGWVEVGSRPVGKNEYEITYDRQLPWEMVVDPNEARYGRPRNLFRISSMSEEEAFIRFVDGPKLRGEAKQKVENAILTAEDADDLDKTSSRVVRMIKVIEGWHLRRSEETPGQHVIATSSGSLFDEEWDREGFPFARIQWCPERIGFHARSLVEQVESLHVEFNNWLQRFAERMNLVGTSTIFYEEGTVEVEKLQSNLEAQLIPYRVGAQPPVQRPPEPIGASEVNYWMGIKSLAYETTGVSQMSASAMKDPGVDSGVALRMMADKQSGRFSTFSEAYERLYVDLALCTIAECKSLDGKVKVRSEKRGTIDFKSVELPERQYDITSHGANALSSDPAQRLATAQELFGAGCISQQTFMRLIQLPDLESELNQSTVEDRYADWVAWKLLDADENDKDNEAERLQPELLLGNKLRVMGRLANYYMDAVMEDAPEFNLQLMRQFIGALDAEITRQEQEKAQNAPPPPDAGLPMMPPGPPPMPGPGAGPMPMAPGGAA